MSRTRLTPLAQALVIRALRAEHAPPLIGAALGERREAVAAGEHDRHPAAKAAGRVESVIRRVALDGMPPDTDLVATLLEALAVRTDGSHASAWRSIGVRPGRGRDLLARQAHAVDWPLWRTLRDAALDGVDIVRLDA